MKRLPRRVRTFALLVALVAILDPQSSRAAPSQVTLTLDVGARGATISPTLFGLMFEEINHSGDGGIYAELIANRAMLDNAPSSTSGDGSNPSTDFGGTPNYDPWTVDTTGQALATLDLDARDPVNTKALPESLRLTITRVARGERVSVANPGYSGLPIRASTTYRVSFYARSDARFKGPLSVSLETGAAKVFAAATISSLSTNWRRYAVTLTTRAGIAPSEDNQFMISATHIGTIWLSLVSMFPPTWNNRPNGMRIDLMRDLVALHPTFLRIPGGNYLEGQTLASRFQWKTTIGDLTQRPGHEDDAWGYRSTDGLGLLEYLEWCEDLHATRVLAVFAGYVLSGQYIAAGPSLKPYVQDALDEIQYATGSLSTTWGARRAADGHPAPFKVDYVEVGNEDFFDRSSSYDGRFAQFATAIHQKYPGIKLIATSLDATAYTPDMVDLHFYEPPEWFVAHADYFDSYSRTAPKVMVGEYAAQPDGSQIARGAATLGGALGEAAWMTGLERNSDVVRMASYAPLFQNVNQDEYQWTPDLISFDALNSYGSPSYYVQQLFSANHGDVVVPVTRTGSAPLTYVASRTTHGTAMYLTVVNTGSIAVAGNIALKGVSSVAANGTVTVLTSVSTDDENSLDAPRTVYPATRAIHTLGLSFAYRFAANSLTVFRFSATPAKD